MEETELVAAEAEAREGSESGPESDLRLKAFLAEEEERVADAIAVTEVLMPALSARLTGLKSSPAALPVPKPRPTSSGITGEAPGIADFIDEMLAQDRSASR